MNDAFYISGVGLGAQERALGTVANNIANLNTQGFKRSSVEFTELLSPDASRSLSAGVIVAEQLQMSEQGALEQTGQKLDLAIDGDGFIEVLGPNGQSLLWRGGHLRVGSDGYLQTSSGYVLRDMINVPVEAVDISIQSGGVVVSGEAGGDLTELGQISLVRLDDLSQLERVQNGLYLANKDASLLSVLPGELGAGSLVQGSVERSSVDLNREMVGMMIIQRAYASNAQVLQAADRLMSIANSLRQQ